MLAIKLATFQTRHITRRSKHFSLTILDASEELAATPSHRIQTRLRRLTHPSRQARDKRRSSPSDEEPKQHPPPGAPGDHLSQSRSLTSVSNQFSLALSRLPAAQQGDLSAEPPHRPAPERPLLRVAALGLANARHSAIRPKAGSRRRGETSHLPRTAQPYTSIHRFGSGTRNQTNQQANQ